MRNYRPKQSDTSEHHGTPRNDAEPYGSPKSCYPALESAIIRCVSSEFSNIFGAQRPPSQHPSGAGGGMRNYRPKQSDTAEHHGTPGNATEPAGASKFRLSRKGIRHILADSFQILKYFWLPTPPFPTPSWEMAPDAPSPTPRWGRRGDT